MRHQSRVNRPWFSLVCLVVLAAGIAAAFLISGRAPPHESYEPPAVRAIPRTPPGRQAGAATAPDPLFAPVDPAAVPDDVVAERVVDAGRTRVPLDPDDASYRREDGVASHIGEPLDPDDELAVRASGVVSHIGDYLDAMDE